MPLIEEASKNRLVQVFNTKLKDDVTLLFFKGDTPECVFCDHIEELLKEINSLNEKIKYRIYDINSPEAKIFGIISAPTLTFERKPNVRFLGIPSGHEFTVLVDDIIHISRNEIDLKYSTAKALSNINSKVHIMVFVTPTCPYCPITVRMAHQFALFNKNIISDMVEAIEYQNLSSKWSVMAVPKVVINEKKQFEGAYPEEHFVNFILEAVKQ